MELIALDDRLRMVPADTTALADETAALLAAARTARASGDTESEWRVLRPAGVALVALGDHEGARTALERSLELAVSGGEPFREAAVLVNLGDAHRYAGDPGRADACYVRAVGLARAGSPGALAFCLHHYGKHLTEAGRLPEAVTALREALALRLAADRPDPALADSTRRALRRAGAEG